MKTVLVALAGVAATTLVGLAVSDGWALAKKRAGRFVSGALGNSAGAAEAEQVHSSGTAPAVPPANPASRSVPTPNQLPSVRGPFVNRVAELATLEGWLDGASGPAAAVGLGVVKGLPGVGKSATVMTCAAGRQTQFPDGQLYVDYAALRKEIGGDVSEAAAMCLRALGVRDEYLPASLVERTGLLRSKSADLRLLLVLDNVDQPAQVIALIPKGPGSVVLVTSNHALDELAHDGAQSLALEPLDVPSGLLLLSARCGAEAVAAEPAAAGRLVELCDGLPLALHVAASRVSPRHGRTLAVVADELGDETRRLAGLSRGGERVSVSANFNLAYAGLPPEAARLYRRLGWFPGRVFDARTAAVVADVDSASAGSLLEALETASLLVGTDDGRYRFHNLVRLHAGERAAADEPEAEHQLLIERVMKHYLARTAFADRAIRQDRLRIAELDEFLRERTNPFAADGRPAALAWLEAERGNLLALLEIAASSDLPVMGWQLAEGITVLFLHHRHLREWLASSEWGVACAVAAGDTAAEARLLSLSSRPLMDLKEYERARERLEQAVDRADASGDTALRASVLELFGRYWDRFDLPSAVAAYKESIRLNREAEEWRGVALATYFLGCTQDASGQHTKALETLRDARRKLLACNDQRMAARALASIGRVHDHLGDSTAATAALSEAANVLQQDVDATAYEAQARVDLARIVRRTDGNPATEREHLSRAWEIYTEGGNPDADEIRERLDELGGPAAP